MNRKIDAKFILVKTLTFLLLSTFIGLFSAAFGQDNVLIGVMVVVLALMLLAKDMSARPAGNLFGLIAICMSLGLGAYVALIDPWLGLLVNFPLVFLLTYVTMHNLKMPFWFPFLLGYGFILSMPVSMEALPLRLASLAVGALFIFGFNLVMNFNKTKKTCHSAIIDLLDDTITVIDTKIAGGTIDMSGMDKKSDTIMSAMYSRIRDKYFISLSSRSVLNLAVAIRSLGNIIVADEHDKKNLEDLKSLLADLRSHEDADGSTYSKIHDSIMLYIRTHPDVTPGIPTSLKIVDYELDTMENADKTEGLEYDADDIPSGFRLKTLLRENLRTDSVKFTFAFRMAVMVAFWAFIGDYYDLENCKWLVFTSIAIVQPYIEGSMSKSVMRLKGTAAGILVFLLLTPMTAHPELITVAMMLIGYVYTLFDPMRYDLQMAFTTLSALLMALTLFPEGSVVWERLIYIVAGVGAAMLANHVIFPYHLNTETSDLSKRNESIVRNQIRDLGRTLKGCGDNNKSAALMVTSCAISDKIRLNNERGPNESAMKLLSIQNEIVLNTSYLKLTARSVDTIDEKTKAESAALLDRYGPDGDEELPTDLTSDNGYVHGIIQILRSYANSKKIGENAISG